jgi:hypothetical protein
MVWPWHRHVWKTYKKVEVNYGGPTSDADWYEFQSCETEGCFAERIYLHGVHVGYSFWYKSNEE